MGGPPEDPAEEQKDVPGPLVEPESISEGALSEGSEIDLNDYDVEENAFWPKDAKPRNLRYHT